MHALDHRDKYRHVVRRVRPGTNTCSACHTMIWTMGNTNSRCQLPAAFCAGFGMWVRPLGSTQGSHSSHYCCKQHATTARHDPSRAPPEIKHLLVRQVRHCTAVCALHIIGDDLRTTCMDVNVRIDQKVGQGELRHGAAD